MVWGLFESLREFERRFSDKFCISIECCSINVKVEWVIVQGSWLITNNVRREKRKEEKETKKMLTVVLMLLMTISIALIIRFVAAGLNPIINLNSDLPLICVVVHESIYDAIQSYIERYVTDVTKIGFNATTVLFSEGNHEDVKAILMGLYSKGLVGCLLVGDIPWAVYEDLEVDHEEYPCDLYYTDLDGFWIDTDRNEKYDQHTGNRAPEIWVGRIKIPDRAESEEVSLIQDYFDKNHAYRTGVLPPNGRALIYIDDDWADLSEDVDLAVALVYENRTLVNKESTTNSSDYLDRLAQNWSLVHVMVHGSSYGHNFMTYEQPAGGVFAGDIMSVDPHVFFYNIFSCKVMNYSKVDYVGAWYIFNCSYGLAAIGSTDVGGMLYCDDFYSDFKYEILGFSFQRWLATRVDAEDRGSSYGWTWYYGMTIIGDPTLSAGPDIEGPDLKNTDVAITEINPYKTVVSNNTSMFINVTTDNQGPTIETFNVTLYYNTNQIGTQTVTLYVSQMKVITLEWNTTGLPLGNYTISAYATPVPNETDTADNNYTYGWIIISIAGDITGTDGWPDRKISIQDLFIVAKAFGSHPRHPKWNPNADLNTDKKINIRDLKLVSDEYGKTIED